MPKARVRRLGRHGPVAPDRDSALAWDPPEDLVVYGLVTGAMALGAAAARPVGALRPAPLLLVILLTIIPSATFLFSLDRRMRRMVPDGVLHIS